MAFMPGITPWPVAPASFDDRPTAVNRQKRVFARQVADFMKCAFTSRHTDISGGILRAVEYPGERDAGNNTILIFSDLKEDPEDGYARDFDPEPGSFEVIALNLTTLRSDNVDQVEYLSRLENLRGRVENAGSDWRVINDLDGLDGML